jgi:hypothetical protein
LGSSNVLAGDALGCISSRTFAGCAARRDAPGWGRCETFCPGVKQILRVGWYSGVDRRARETFIASSLKQLQ